MFMYQIYLFLVGLPHFMRGKRVKPATADGRVQIFEIVTNS